MDDNPVMLSHPVPDVKTLPALRLRRSVDRLRVAGTERTLSVPLSDMTLPMPSVAFQPIEHRFDSADAMTDALADAITAALQAGLATGRGASLLLPGGRTPVALMQRLTQQAVDWGSVWVSLTDERWVPTDTEQSNEHLVREQLLRDKAGACRFVGLKNDATDAARGAADAWSALSELPRPFDTVVLGMGDDGHIASLFPNTAALATGLDLTQRPGCIATSAPVAPSMRLSLNLRALLDARQVIVLTMGASKWETYQRARRPGPVADMPVRALSAQQNVPVSLYWAP